MTDPRKLVTVMRQDAKWARKQLHPALAHDMEKAATILERWAPIVERAREPEVARGFRNRVLYRCKLVCRGVEQWTADRTRIHAPDCPLHEEDPA